MSEKTKPSRKISEHLAGWPVVGGASLLLLGAGFSIMTAPHPYIADAFFFAGFSLLVIKFWTWEEAKHNTTRKTAALLAGVTVFAILLFAGSCWLSSYINANSQAVKTAVSTTPFPSAPPPITVFKTAQGAPTTPQPQRTKPVLPAIKPESLPTKKIQAAPPTALGSITQTNSGGVNVLQGTTGDNSPISNSPIILGDFPAPPRYLSQDQKNKLSSALRAGAGHTFRTISTGSEASQYALEIAGVFRASGWTEASSVTANSGEDGSSEPITIFSMAGETQLTRLVQSAFQNAEISLPFHFGYPGPGSLGYPDVIIDVRAQPNIARKVQR